MSVSESVKSNIESLILQGEEKTAYALQVYLPLIECLENNNKKLKEEMLKLFDKTLKLKDKILELEIDS